MKDREKNRLHVPACESCMWATWLPLICSGSCWEAPALTQTGLSVLMHNISWQYASCLHCKRIPCAGAGTRQSDFQVRYGSVQGPEIPAARF